MIDSLAPLSTLALSLQESDGSGAGALLGGGLFLIVFLLISAALTVFWVLMLINAAKQEKWGWFVVMLLFGFAAFIYYFVGYRKLPAGGARS